MPAPCDRCDREVTLLYGHRQDDERLQLCGECHPERSGPVE